IVNIYYCQKVIGKYGKRNKGEEREEENQQKKKSKKRKKENSPYNFTSGRQKRKFIFNFFLEIYFRFFFLT
ncbi:MAG: hypothetical protein IJ516_04910, partial [Phascolarctobacterium sp.]|nr:hypothetical protein [Phascolarctobacterium sp.]MBQ8691144.1 hypothetical protein [Phascolarctobacterium sp.]